MAMKDDITISRTDLLDLVDQADLTWVLSLPDDDVWFENAPPLRVEIVRRLRSALATHTHGSSADPPSDQPQRQQDRPSGDPNPQGDSTRTAGQH